MPSHVPVAIITGGGTGVGAANISPSGPSGWSVVVNYSRSKVEADGVVSEILAVGVSAIAVQGRCGGRCCLPRDGGPHRG